MPGRSRSRTAQSRCCSGSPPAISSSGSAISTRTPPYGGSAGGACVHHTELGQLARAGSPELSARMEQAGDLYDRHVRTLDQVLARLLAYITDEGSAKGTTHLIFTSDQGESFGEGGYLGHSKQVTPEQVRVRS